MSDEYHDSGQFKDSLVQESVKDVLPRKNNENYPPPNDTTSEGGSSGDPLTRSAQRGFNNTKSQPQQPDASSSTVQAQGTRTPNSFGTSGLQSTENKSADHPGFENSEPCSASSFVSRKGETYESAAAGNVDATETQ